jgi:hypothetical protein
MNTRRFTWFGPPEHNTLRAREMFYCCVYVALFKAELNLCKVQVVRNWCLPGPFIAQGWAVTLCLMAQQVVPGWLKPIIVLGFLWLGIVDDGLGGTWSVPCPVALVTLQTASGTVHDMTLSSRVAWHCCSAPRVVNKAGVVL